MLTQDHSSIDSRLPFLCLVGFVAFQGYLIPIAAVPPVNWAIWPSLPDLFAIGLVAIVVFSPVHRNKLTPFDRGTIKDLVWMELVFTVNFILVTIPLSSTGDGIRFGGYSLIIFGKYVAVYWAAAHVPINQKRMQILHVAALIAFLWLSISTLADRLSFIEIDNYARHLPTGSAGKWDVSILHLDSTVSSTHGGTTVVLLVIIALMLGTARHQLTWFLEGISFILGVVFGFISGSRQGLVRIITFIATYSARKPGRFIALASIFLLFTIFLLYVWNPFFSSIEDNPYYSDAVMRQGVLIYDPFSNEGLSGRPELWQSVFDTLNDNPLSWLIGYGMGNYVEYDNAAHNMILQFLQDGGFIELILLSILWIRIFIRIWRARHEAWSIVSLTVAMFTSVLTSAIFYPNLSTGWYLGLYFVALHIMIGNDERQ